MEVDQSCKDVARACFLCYDKDAYYNEEADIFDQLEINTLPTNSAEQSIPSTSINDNEKIDMLVIWLDKKESFVSGNRNNYVSQLAAACNRFGIPKAETEAYLLTYEQPDYTAKEITSTVRSIYKNTSYHGTAEFEPSSILHF